MPSLDSVQVALPKLDDNNDQRSKDKYEKMIHRNKLDRMIIKIVEAEMNFYLYSKKFNHTLSTMWKNHRELVKNKGMTTILTNLIDQHLKIIADRCQDIYTFRLKCFFHHHLCFQFRRCR